MTKPDDRPWTRNHQPHILMQMDARSGQATADGTRWTERRLTGLGVALCDCGYTTGLIPREQLPDTAQFAAEHPPFGWPGREGATGGGTAP